MRAKRANVWLLSCAMVLSGCATSGRVAKQISECPKPPPVPAAMLTAPDYESQVRSVLFNSAPSATPESAPSKD